jgi:uncharacterized membrane protein YtjA (UPF0391 family)
VSHPPEELYVNISVADLAMTATAEDLRQLFEPYGIASAAVTSGGVRSTTSGITSIPIFMSLTLLCISLSPSDLSGGTVP